jgi:predicted transcriptional regulator
MFGFKGSSQHIGWSANLRVKTVKALSFLEEANLIEIQNRKGRLQITELGKKVINRALSKDDNLAWNLTIISRSYRNICVSKQLDMEL